MEQNNNDRFKVVEKKKINIYLPENILNRIDEYATEFGVNRSAMIAFITKQYIDQQEVVKMGRIADLQEELQSLIKKVKGE